MLQIISPTKTDIYLEQVWLTEVQHQDKNCNVVNHRLHVCTEAHNIDSFIAVSVSKVSLDKMFSYSLDCLRVTRCQGMSGNDDGWGWQWRVTIADCLPRPAPVTPPRAGTRARWAPQLKQYKWYVTLLFNRGLNEDSSFHIIRIRPLKIIALSHLGICKDTMVNRHLMNTGECIWS